jgi:hypothetical protein
MDPQDVHWATGGLHHEWLNILHSPTFSLSPFPSIIIVGGLQSLKLWWRFADRIFSFFTTTLRPYDRTSRCSRTTRSVNCIIRNSSYALLFTISEPFFFLTFVGERTARIYSLSTQDLWWAYGARGGAAPAPLPLITLAFTVHRQLYWHRLFNHVGWRNRCQNLLVERLFLVAVTFCCVPCDLPSPHKRW